MGCIFSVEVKLFARKIGLIDAPKRHQVDTSRIFNSKIELTARQ
jgi:hypothetical protein